MKELARKMALAGVGAMLLGGVAFANVGNDHTGFDSDNNASVETETETSVENDNDADIWNHIKGFALSGENKSEKNTGDGAVDTGSASGTVKITNTANDNIADITAPGGDESVSVENSTTGANSDNDAWVKMESEIEVENDNDADVHNDLCLTANSGGNRASFNTGDGMVDTGNASLDVTITNTLNSNDVTVE